jgi:hypothetical protein
MMNFRQCLDACVSERRRPGDTDAARHISIYLSYPIPTEDECADVMIFTPYYANVTGLRALYVARKDAGYPMPPGCS